MWYAWAMAAGRTEDKIALLERVPVFSALGPEEWAKGMNPDVPETKILDNPYTYTEYRSATTHDALADPQSPTTR